MSQDAGSANRLPPHNRDAERSLLGSMLRDNELIADIVHLVRAEHFYVFAHQKILQGDHEAQRRRAATRPIPSRSAIPEREPAHRGRRRRPHLIELWDAAPSAANAVHYAEIIRQKAIVRNLIHACTELHARRVRASRPAQRTARAAERRILEIAEMGVTGDNDDAAGRDQGGLRAARCTARSTATHEFSGIPTGLPRSRQAHGRLAELRTDHPRRPAQRRQDGVRAQHRSATSSSRKAAGALRQPRTGADRTGRASAVLPGARRQPQAAQGHSTPTTMAKLIEAGGILQRRQAVHRRHAGPEHAAHRRQRPPAEAAARHPHWS